MPERSSKQEVRESADEPDISEIAANIVVQATGRDRPQKQPELTPDGKNAAAVALGRLGGLKGGKARAKKLTKRKRSEIAKKAALVRWRYTQKDVEDGQEVQKKQKPKKRAKTST